MKPINKVLNGWIYYFRPTGPLTRMHVRTIEMQRLVTAKSRVAHAWGKYLQEKLGEGDI
jgi:hypothetical protein